MRGLVGAPVLMGPRTPHSGRSVVAWFRLGPHVTGEASVVVFRRFVTRSYKSCPDFVRETLFHLRHLIGQEHHASVESLHVCLHVGPVGLRRGARILALRRSRSESAQESVSVHLVRFVMRSCRSAPAQAFFEVPLDQLLGRWLYDATPRLPLPAWMSQFELLQGLGGLRPARLGRCEPTRPSARGRSWSREVLKPIVHYYSRHSGGGRRTTAC